MENSTFPILHSDNVLAGMSAKEYRAWVSKAVESKAIEPSVNSSGKIITSPYYTAIVKENKRRQQLKDENQKLHQPESEKPPQREVANPPQEEITDNKKAQRDLFTPEERKEAQANRDRIDEQRKEKIRNSILSGEEWGGEEANAVFASAEAEQKLATKIANEKGAYEHSPGVEVYKNKIAPLQEFLTPEASEKVGQQLIRAVNEEGDFSGLYNSKELESARLIKKDYEERLSSVNKKINTIDSRMTELNDGFNDQQYKERADKEEQFKKDKKVYEENFKKGFKNAEGKDLEGEELEKAKAKFASQKEELDKRELAETKAGREKLVQQATANAREDFKEQLKGLNPEARKIKAKELMNSGFFGNSIYKHMSEMTGIQDANELGEIHAMNIAEKEHGNLTNKRAELEKTKRNMKTSEWKQSLARESVDVKGNYSRPKSVSTSSNVKSKLGVGKMALAAGVAGVAIAGLASVGTANMMMAGGSQPNSNLYNPYQASY